MNIFKSEENDKVISLLASAKTDFIFDQKGTKEKLFSKLKHSPQIPKRSSLVSNNIFLFRCGIAFAAIILFIGTTTYVSADSRPGDKLFSLNKLREKILVSLPFNAEHKAEVQASIVEDRLKALDEVPVEVPLKIEARSLETIKETEQTLNQALENITRAQVKAQDQGKTEKVEKLQGILDRIGEQLEKREQTIEKIEQQARNYETRKEQIQEELRNLRRARQKALEQTRKRRSDDSSMINSDKTDANTIINLGF
jgi:hypothetical protein